MALPTRRAGVLLQLLLVVLALAVSMTCADAARAPAALQEEDDAAAAGPGQAPPPTGSDAVPVEALSVSSSTSAAEGEAEGKAAVYVPMGFTGGDGTGYDGCSRGGQQQQQYNSAPGGRDGVWKVGASISAATVVAAAWLL